MTRRQLGTAIGLISACCLRDVPPAGRLRLRQRRHPTPRSRRTQQKSAPLPPTFRTPTDASVTTDAPPPTESVITGPAPGVTDTEIKLGITYVDVEALKAVGIDLNIGDLKAAYQALADDINKTGINGRKLTLVFAPVDPSVPASAEEACVKLTEDEDVFAVVGYARGDAATCIVDTHATALIGGDRNAERIAAAKAPWITGSADDEVPTAIIKAFEAKGLLAGKVGVWSHVQTQTDVDQVSKALADLGIQPLETLIADFDTNDVNASQAMIRLHAEKFKSAGVDTLILVGGNGASWLTTMEKDTSFRPKLLFTNTQPIGVLTSSETTTDLSILDGTYTGGLFGPNQAVWEDATMQACIAIIEAAGQEVPSPDAVAGIQGDTRYQLAFQTCPPMALAKALLDKAGKNLNYGTLDSALNGLEVTVPGDPAPRTYGPGGAGDGNPSAFLFTWDAARKDLVLDNS